MLKGILGCGMIGIGELRGSGFNDYFEFSLGSFIVFCISTRSEVAERVHHEKKIGFAVLTSFSMCALESSGAARISRGVSSRSSET